MAMRRLCIRVFALYASLVLAIGFVPMQALAEALTEIQGGSVTPEAEAPVFSYRFDDEGAWRSLSSLDEAVANEEQDVLAHPITQIEHSIEGVDVTVMMETRAAGEDWPDEWEDWDGEDEDDGEDLGDGDSEDGEDEDDGEDLGSDSEDLEDLDDEDLEDLDDEDLEDLDDGEDDLEDDEEWEDDDNDDNPEDGDDSDGNSDDWTTLDTSEFEEFQAWLVYNGEEEECPYEIWYRVHAGDFGWLGWTSGGGSAGTRDMGAVVDGLQFLLMPIEDELPDDNPEPFLDGEDYDFGGKDEDEIELDDEDGSFGDDSLPFDFVSDSSDGIHTGVDLSGDKGVAASNGSASSQTAKVSLKDATIESISKQAYTGSAVTPKLKVRLDGKTLKEGTDYTLSYANNIEVGTASVTVKGKGAYTGTKKASFKIVAPSVTYRVHVQSYGDQSAQKDGAVAGTSGESKRLEAIWLKLGSGFPVSGGITYQTHVQTYGWQDWVSDGEKSGTSGESKRLEAIRIKLTDAMAKKYDVWYRVHAQRVGWTNWAKNGQTAGTSGLSWRLEAIQVVLALKGGNAPGDVGGISSASSSTYIRNPGITYHTHVQTYGWQDWVKNGKMAGTSGESKRLEALEVKLAADHVAGSVRYRTHVQTYGWQDWKTNGALAGTEGESKRLEAIQIKLTGEASQYFDVWYRVHVQTYGWLGWAKNGAKAGTANLSRRMESMQIKLLPKDSAAPGSTEKAFIDQDPTLSGDLELDAMIGQLIQQTGTGYDGLRRAYEIISSYPYSQGNHWPGPNWQEWSIPYAKEMYRNGTGNCYRYASLMCWTARRLGFDARVVPGWNHGVYTMRIDHGWVEVYLDGHYYLIDAELNSANAYPEYDWFMIRYADARVGYYDLNDNRILYW